MALPVTRIHNLKRQISTIPLPVTITSLQWDCDGALHDFDRDWMLLNLAMQDPLAGQADRWISPGIRRTGEPHAV